MDEFYQTFRKKKSYQFSRNKSQKIERGLVLKLPYMAVLITLTAKPQKDIARK